MATCEKCAELRALTNRLTSALEILNIVIEHDGWPPRSERLREHVRAVLAEANMLYWHPEDWELDAVLRGHCPSCGIKTDQPHNCISDGQ